MIFKILDYAGTPVILSKTAWFDKLLDPIFGHPEVKPFLSQIKRTIKEPDYVYQSLRDSRSKLLIGKITKGIFASYFLVIVVKYVKEDDQLNGYVSTVMINRKLPKQSKLLWARRVSI